MSNNDLGFVLLGRQLSMEELKNVSGGDVITCTPSIDGCADDNGNDVPCFEEIR
ncbi:bacteriocin [Alkalimonas mucilaginosa]|uniref:Bacteriocin n=1 Tax=Alkalimonas mucilaginosa TaxID=3057676 RepID=A0ABU7JEF2_9GAMM|nr:bacteriocin [Alkalimonas sp. MEB004]MEE2024073.1 bacteriocin [Alkalimonas sp. MEB004]